MKTNKKRKVFNLADFYELCHCEVTAIGIETESYYKTNFLDNASDELIKKYDALSPAGQKEFLKELRKVAKKYISNFNNLLDSEELIFSVSKEDLAKDFKERQDDLTYNIANDLSEFWTGN